ncbi:MAG: hypothetical protein O2887_14160 [Bacteroidetes bacterium]|nr:hypothetical protein [Bacteroidota bacterium]MDA1121613.1 hypothetical protein [Bacteroidota bacterium]
MVKDYHQETLVTPVLIADRGRFFYDTVTMNSWLDNFAYRINIGWVEFATSFLTLILIMELTMTLQVWKSANVNPVESLRSE